MLQACGRLLPLYASQICLTKPSPSARVLCCEYMHMYIFSYMLREHWCLAALSINLTLPTPLAQILYYVHMAHPVLHVGIYIVYQEKHYLIYIALHFEMILFPSTSHDGKKLILSSFLLHVRTCRCSSSPQSNEHLVETVAG